ncbi:YicC/YloC family endoribonuclease [Minwuia sp.]|uniref:YicC/YloC family endoribonuclease n=1 Tax=Minwuia sp. TaxID=2493630 RepID=UPI003A8F4A3B
MTGFARTEGVSENWRWVWELRSVNGKGLDVRLRLPSGFDGFEQTIRKTVQAQFARGNISVSLQLDHDADNDGFRVNREWLDELVRIAREADPAGEVRVDRLMQVRGVVEPASLAEDDAVIATRNHAVVAALGQAVEALKTARRDEGGRLGEVLTGIVDTIETLVLAARKNDSLRPEARRERLVRMLSELTAADPPVSEDRLASELALQMTKSDITEELDRLVAHVAQARALLSSDEPVGRRLDFLSQEFNREANTLCSKSGDVELTRVGMDMKIAIDRMREQVQNIE